MRLVVVIFTTIFSLASIYIVHSDAIEVSGNFLMPQASNELIQPARFQESFIETSFAAYSHASSFTELENGELLATWYSGSREGANDVKIYLANFNPATASWERQRAIVDSNGLEKDLNRKIRKLGNPVISQAPDGKVWLFFVSVSFGGWAGSSINAIYSNDGGNSWSKPKRLITSPLVNISSLVKQPPVYFENGNILLPIYHEFIGKFSEALLLSPDGKVIDKSRITWGMYSLQPSFAALDSTHLLAMNRNANHGDSIVSAISNSSPISWQLQSDTGIPNPNSSVAITRLQDGRVLLATNDMALSRNKLSLFISSDGQSWKKIKQLEYHHYSKIRYKAAKTSKKELLESVKNESKKLKFNFTAEMLEQLTKNMCGHHETCESHYAYPYLIQTKNGDIHLLYTWNKSIIKHVRFNTTWLDQKESAE